MEEPLPKRLPKSLEEDDEEDEQLEASAQARIPLSEAIFQLKIIKIGWGERVDQPSEGSSVRSSVNTLKRFYLLKVGCGFGSDGLCGPGASGQEGRGGASSFAFRSVSGAFRCISTSRRIKLREDQDIIEIERR